MGRSPCCEKVGLKRGRWTDEEDEILRKYIEANGEGCWRSLPKNAGLLRCGKSCRLRWINYLRSDLKRGNISSEEEEMIINLRASLGNRWSLIAAYLPGRTDNEIKNYWNSHLSRKIQSRRPNPNFVLPQLTAAVAAPASTKATRRTGRRTGRSAMKVDKNSNHKVSTIPKASVQADDNSNGAANGAFQMPTTPNSEKEPISRPVQRQEKNGGDNIPASLEKGEEVEIENGFLCLADFMEDLDGLLSLDDERENRGVTENRVDERQVDFSGGDKLGPGNGEWNGLMMMSSPGNSWDDENTFSWFWECEKEKDFSDVVSLEVDSDRHNAMVSWLTS